MTNPRTPIVKLHVVTPSNDGSVPNSDEDTTIAGLFDGTGVEEPPYDPGALFKIFEGSGGLRSNVDSMAMNIDGRGHMFRARFDLEDEDTPKLIALAMADAAQRDSVTGPSPTSEGGDGIADLPLHPVPSEAEVQARLKELRSEFLRERTRLQMFFDHCCADESFVQLRKASRLDLEVCGNSYWEVLRDENGTPSQFNKLPATTVRLLPPSSKWTPVLHPVQENIITFTSKVIMKKFRLYVQRVASQTVYFKELGDPALYSAWTGKVYPDIEALAAEENEQFHGVTPPPATELIHFKVYSPVSAYGVPRWIGELPSVLGTRDAEEVNLMYFENKGIPPMVIKVMGARLGKDSKHALENYIKNEIKGKRNFHKIMILEAEPSSTIAPPMSGMQTGMMRIEIEPLTKFQQNDGQFMDYIERSTNRLGQTFRLPKLLRGSSGDMNRATSQTSLKFAEGQVFKPERAEFDFIINRKILPLLNVHYFDFVSNGPDFTEPIELVVMLMKMSQAGILTPEELRELAEKLFGKPFRKIREEWTSRPMVFTQAAISSKTADVDGTNLFDEVQEAVANSPSPGDSEEQSNDKEESKMDAVEKLLEAYIAQEFNDNEDAYYEAMDQLHATIIRDDV